MSNNKKDPSTNTKKSLHALRVPPAETNNTPSVSKPSTYNNIVAPSPSTKLANDKLPAIDTKNTNVSKTSTDGDKIPKKRPTKEMT